MAKFSQVIKGSRARKRGVAFTTLSGAETTCDLVVLNGTDEEEILAAATAAAKKAGAEPSEGSIAFDFARACEIVFRAAVDPESPDDRPARFFDSIAEVKDHLDRERIFLLFDEQDALQNEASPRPSKMELDGFLNHLYEHALVPEGEMLPFERWQPVLRRSWVRFLVDRALSSIDPRSLSSSAAGSSSVATSGTSHH